MPPIEDSDKAKFPIYSFEGLQCDRKEFLTAFKDIHKDLNYFRNSEQNPQKANSTFVSDEPFTKEFFKKKQATASKRLQIKHFTVIFNKGQHFAKEVDSNPGVTQRKIVRSKSVDLFTHDAPMIEFEVDGFLMFDHPI